MTTPELAALARRRLDAIVHPAPDGSRFISLDERVYGGRRREDVRPEGPVENLRNALQILRFTIEHDEPLIGNGCPAVAVPITSLARIQARIEAAIEQLECARPRDMASDLLEDR